MIRSTPDLCDTYPELVRVVDPMFINFGARERFGGQISTVKCFEDNSLVKQAVSEPGLGRVLVVDSGGSMRRACLGDMLANQASQNGWSGLVIYGCIRDVDEIMVTDIGVQALGLNPMKTEKKGLGERDVTVTFGGVSFKPNEFLYADNNGIIVSVTALT